MALLPLFHRMPQPLQNHRQVIGLLLIRVSNKWMNERMNDWRNERMNGIFRMVSAVPFSLLLIKVFICSLWYLQFNESSSIYSHSEYWIFGYYIFTTDVVFCKWKFISWTRQILFFDVSSLKIFPPDYIIQWWTYIAINIVKTKYDASYCHICFL